MNSRLNDLKGIRHLARYAAFAYCDTNEFRMHAPELQGPTGLRTLEAKGPSFFTQNTRVHLGIRDNQTLVIAFGGYDYPWLYEDWFIPIYSQYRFLSYAATDLRFSLTQIDWNDVPIGVQVHKQYLLTFNKMRDDLLNHICELLNVPPESAKTASLPNIEVCGHGLGGAFATLCAFWCATQWNTAKITCVTLGSPMVGNLTWYMEFDQQREISCYRLETESDPFVTMPYVQVFRGAPIWQHVGTQIYLPLYKGHPKSFKNLCGDFLSRVSGYKAFGYSVFVINFMGDTIDMLEAVFIYLGVYFGLWIGLYLLKGSRLLLNASVHSPMVYLTCFQGEMEEKEEEMFRIEEVRTRSRLPAAVVNRPQALLA